MAKKHFLAETDMKVQSGLLQNSGIPVALLLLQEGGILSKLAYAPVFCQEAPFTAVSGFVAVSGHLLALGIAGREKNHHILYFIAIFCISVCSVAMQSNTSPGLVLFSLKFMSDSWFHCVVGRYQLFFTVTSHCFLRDHWLPWLCISVKFCFSSLFGGEVQ